MSGGTVTLTANGKSMDEFLRAIERFRKEVGNSEHVACRRGIIYLLQSLRARTRQSARTVKRSAVKRVPKGEGHWIRDKKTGVEKRNWTVERRGGADKYTAHVLADSAAAARTSKRGTFAHRGLAKLAWMKIAQALFNQGGKSDYSGNEPAGIASASYTYTGGDFTRPRVTAVLWNHLAYATAALTDSLDSALGAAKRRMVHLIENHLVTAKEALK